VSAAPHGAAPEDAHKPPRLFERVRIVTFQPPNYPHSAAFDELALGLATAFAALGSQVDVAVNQPLQGEGINLVLGAHLIAPNVVLPGNTIIFNTEQIRSGGLVQSHYLDRLRGHPVLDYSERNAALICARAGHAHVHALALGYVPALSRIGVAARQDVDVLFYGVVNERRQKVLAALGAAGLMVKVLPPGTYGAERDAWIGRSKVVLNLHYYDDKIHEIVRTSYLLANRKCVVSECDADTDIAEDIRAAVVGVPYDKLVETCVALVTDDTRRREVEAQALAIFSRRDQAAMLAALLPALSLTLPRRINLGSGKAYDPVQLNIDIAAKWQPDVVGDIAARGGLQQIYFSRRFGLVRLDAGAFDEINTMDVLEHIPDLVTMMTRCLDLLREGGTMRIVVPYDLSWGAWQDPTHVRAFNERSWLYYTDWHWYLGWIEARFETKEMGMKLSAVGETLRQRGIVGDELFRTPRAVDEMHVALVKRACTDSERSRAREYLGSARADE